MANVSKFEASKYSGKDLIIIVDSNQKERPTPKQPRNVKNN